MESQANTYEPLEGRSNSSIPMDSPETDIRSPKDQRHAVYMALLAAGIGFVLPYNSFIIASDYWQERFPGRSVALDMSMTYITVAFATVLLNNVFLSLASFRMRVLFGYIISFITLVFVAICEVAWHMFATNTAYSINLAAVSLVAIGCTVQQSSFYGFASMLPKQYTQAVMAGESIAGFLVSSNRVFTKLLIQNERLSTVIFFLTSTLYIIFSYLLHLATIQSPFVRYHMKASAKIVLQPDEDRLNEVDDTHIAKYGVLTVESTSPSTHNENNSSKALSFSNPVYELSNPTGGESAIDGINNFSDIPSTSQEPSTPTTVAYKVEHVLTPGSCTPGKLSDLKNGFVSRWRVAQAIYPYMVCIALAYCVTLSLYPGIESEIVSCRLGTWMPVLLMFAFNTADVIGKVLAAVPYQWSRRQLILMSGLRIVLVPLLLLCCAPRHQPVVSGETAAFLFTIALGISNGLASSLPMMLAPAKVPGTLKEVTGNMMTLSYNCGLTAGSLIGYVFESMLGAQLTNLCPTIPSYVPASVLDPLSQTSATAQTTTISTMPGAFASLNATAMTKAILTSTLSTLLPTTEASTTAATTTIVSIVPALVAPSAIAITATTTTTTSSSTLASSTVTTIISTIASTLVTIPENIANTIVSNVMTAVSSIGDLNEDINSNTSDPQTPVELMEQI